MTKIILDLSDILNQTQINKCQHKNCIGEFIMQI